MSENSVDIVNRTSVTTEHGVVSENQDKSSTDLPSLIGIKRRLTKQEKKEKRNQRMIEVRHKKYERQKARKKQKVAEAMAVAAPSSLENSSESLEANIVYGPRKKDLLAQKLTNGMQCGVNICVDLSYDNIIHNFRERSSLVKQLILCYAHLKQSNACVHFHLASINPTSLLTEKMHGMGFENWFASRHDKHPEEVWDPSRIVILSPDATDILEDLDADKVYVIGGIVDRTVRKAATLCKAQQIGAQTRRLPLKEHLGNLVTHVLNVDHVFRILCDYCETRVSKYFIV